MKGGIYTDTQDSVAPPSQDMEKRIEVMSRIVHTQSTRLNDKSGHRQAVPRVLVFRELQQAAQDFLEKRAWSPTAIEDGLVKDFASTFAEVCSPYLSDDDKEQIKNVDTMRRLMASAVVSRKGKQNRRTHRSNRAPSLQVS